MHQSVARVSDAASLQQAVTQGVPHIEIDGSIADLPTLRLRANVRVSGTGAHAELRFKSGQPGLVLSANHRIHGLRLATDEAQIALGLADDAEDLGTLEISDISTVGRLHLEASRARRADIKLDNIHVERADARMAAHRPAGFGVEVLLGGISIYNFSKDRMSRWVLEARNLSGGSKDHPLRGSGVFVFGGWFIPLNADMSQAPAPTQEGGSIELRSLITGEIHNDGGIPPGTGNLITGGVFVGSGVQANEIVNEGRTTTYGPNDMVLDNWGKVTAWTAKDGVTSRGSSGIGFVNFGDIDLLKVTAPIETHGLGARGFNLYDGSLAHAEFESITTYGDGAIGVQLSKPFGTIKIARDVRTKGGEGDSLVKGKVVHLRAHGFSIKPGTTGESISVGGRVVAENEAIADWDFEAPSQVVKHIEVAGQRLG